jgi:hypothetical protein
MNTFRYPAAPHRRRHGPHGYAIIESFRPWLRDEFAFGCVYCRYREQWSRLTESQTEDGVLTLEGVRQHLEAASFPCRAALCVFLLLSSPRKGKYAGKILVVNERNDRTIRYVKLVATFQEDNELLPLCVDLGNCVFPEAGQYSFQVYFSPRGGGEALKGEHPFTLISHEE